MKKVIFIKDLPSIRKPSKNGITRTRRRCLCKCYCGVEFETNKDNFLNGGVNSCGCNQNTGLVFKTHGLSKSKEYHCWVDMKQRCYNPKNKAYKNYGERGITVCKEWLNSFETFLEDMGLMPIDKYSIDRINVNKEYSKENCRWADIDEQSNNKRNSRIITYNNETKTLTQWSKYLNMSLSALKCRLERDWSIEDTFTKPIRKLIYTKQALEAEQVEFLG